ncbi:MAG: FAD-binding domain-containing protein [Hasllibacter sp.]
MTGPSILWFKRDLRVADHAPLAEAAARGPVIPLYIAEPDLWAQPDYAARQWAFVRESLAELREALGALGAPLVVRVGEAVPVLEALRVRHAADAMFSHEETGNLWTYGRDLAVGAWARASGVRWVEMQGSGVVRRLPTRDGWAARRERFVMSDLAAPPRAVRPVEGIEPGALPTAADLGLALDPCPERQRGGRSHALRILDSFLHVRGETYRRDMSTPVAGEHACSRLSPHLALGTLSMKEAAQATAERRAALREAGLAKREGWGGSLQSFQSRLAWRDHFMQKQEDEPEIERKALHSALDDLRPRTPDPVRLDAWKAGETGLPFLDACMRYLAHTGWLNFRMRSMVQAVASYHLWLDWRPTSMFLATRFTDYEPGIHWSQTQMQSGVTGMNTVRIYNPVKQGHDQDPLGRFVRRWVPELAEVPDRFVQEPWRWEGAKGLANRYPPPIVDVKAAANEAKSRIYAARKGEAYRAEAREVAERMGSRKPPRSRRRHAAE